MTDVEYTVSHKGGHPLEDLVNPTEEQTEKSLKKHGLTVPDNIKKETAGSNVSECLKFCRKRLKNIDSCHFIKK